MASRYPTDQAFVIHAWCEADGVDKTAGDWHQWDWYATLAMANAQGVRICQTRWIGKDGTHYGKFQVWVLAGETNGR